MRSAVERRAGSGSLEMIARALERALRRPRASQSPDRSTPDERRLLREYYRSRRVTRELFERARDRGDNYAATVLYEMLRDLNYAIFLLKRSMRGWTSFRHLDAYGNRPVGFYDENWPLGGEQARRWEAVRERAADLLETMERYTTRRRAQRSILKHLERQLGPDLYDAMRLALTGHSYREIARAMGITPKQAFYLVEEARRRAEEALK